MKGGRMRRDAVRNHTGWMIGVLLVVAGSAHAGTFLVHPGGETKVVFVSKATMESVEGKTDRMEGVLTLDPGAVGDTITVHLEVDLASLKTGLGRRDKHMRENHLETAKFPKAVFDGATVLAPAGAKLEPGKPVSFDLEGTFAIHGVSRRLRCKAEATYSGAGSSGKIEFRAAFPVTLADYNIARPEFLFLKLAETENVRVSGVAVAAP